MSRNNILKLTVVCAILMVQVSYGQNEEIVNVLKNNKIGKEYSFDYSTKKDGLNKVSIMFLGIIKTDSGKQYKLVTWARVWGKNMHTTGNIYVYSLKNKYIGRYSLGGKDDLPYKLSKDSLYFSNKGKSDCDPKIENVISLAAGLPKEIFLKCKGELGDIYSFSLD